MILRLVLQENRPFSFPSSHMYKLKLRSQILYGSKYLQFKGWAGVLC